MSDTVDLTTRALELEQFIEDKIGWDAQATLVCLGGEEAHLIVIPYLEDGTKPFEVLPLMVKEPELKKLISSSEALLYLCEGWSHSPETMKRVADGELDMNQLTPPSEAPDRVENRIVVGLAPNGESVQVFRLRDGEPQVADNFSGPLVNALKFTYTLAGADIS